MSSQQTITAQKPNSTTSSCKSMSFVLLNLNDKYAESIERDFYKYSAIEIHGIRISHESEKPRGTALEFTTDNPQFFSVYAKACRGGALECVGDFGSYGIAKDYANELAGLYGWTVSDFAKVIFN